MLFWRHIIQALVLSCLMYLSPAAWACKLGNDSTWNLKKPDLIRSAAIIVIAQAEDMLDDKSSLKPNHYDYKFKTIEILKGTIEHSFTLKGFQTFKRGDEEISTPRGYYGTDCEPQVSFTIGKKYILFPNVKNTWSWEEYHGEKDKWVAEIRRNLKKANK